MEWDTEHGHRIQRGGKSYEYDIYKDGKWVATVKGINRVSKIVGLSNTRC